MLRGVGAALSLPILEVMGGPSLRATGKVRSSPRLAYLYFPNGVADGAWGADRGGQDGQLLKLNKWMAPQIHSWTNWFSSVTSDTSRQWTWRRHSYLAWWSI